MGFAVGVLALSGTSRAVVASCAGDCAADGTVVVNELVLGVNMALGNTPVQQCPGFDGNDDGRVAVNELVAAVANALNGCPFTGQYTARIDVGDGETATLQLQVGPDGAATGTLSVAPTAAGRAAIRIEIPLLSLSGSVDLDSGEFHLSGTVSGPDGDVPVDISGSLPERAGGEGSVTLQVGAESFTGPIAAGDGRPTPTPTQVVSTSTPTPTGTPGMLPTEEPGCEGGVVSATITDASGTNSYLSLGGALELGPLTVVLTAAGFGGGTAPCHLMAGDVIRRFQFIILDFGGIKVGTPYALGLRDGAFDYLETPTTNPLGTRGWSADGGTLIIDSLEGSVARFRVVDAAMVPEPTFSAQTPATGTFTLNASGVATRLTRP
jgi:hypothetical protein